MIAITTKSSIKVKPGRLGNGATRGFAAGQDCSLAAKAPPEFISEPFSDIRTPSLLAEA
jgi:hypothetical protein